MGCLKNVTRAIFFTVLIVGFMTLGGQDWIKQQFMNFVNPSKDVVLERAQKIGDFSKVNREFEIEKAAGVLGYSFWAKNGSCGFWQKTNFNSRGYQIFTSGRKNQSCNQQN